MSESAIDLNPLITLKAAAKKLGFDTNMEQETTLLCSLGDKSVKFTAVKKHSSCPRYESKFSLTFLIKGGYLQCWSDCYNPPIFMLINMKEGEENPDSYNHSLKMKNDLKKEGLYPIMPEVIDDEIDFALFNLGFEREITHSLYPNAYGMKNFYADESFDFLRIFKNTKTVYLSKNNSKGTHYAYFNKHDRFEMEDFSIDNIKKIAKEIGFGLNE